MTGLNELPLLAPKLIQIIEDLRPTRQIEGFSQTTPFSARNGNSRRKPFGQYE